MGWRFRLSNFSAFGVADPPPNRDPKAARIRNIGAPGGSVRTRHLRDPTMSHYAQEFSGILK